MPPLMKASSSARGSPPKRWQRYPSLMAAVEVEEEAEGVAEEVAMVLTAAAASVRTAPSEVVRPEARPAVGLEAAVGSARRWRCSR